MPNLPRVFVDSNVLLYLASSDQKKADLAEQLLHALPHVSVQVLNEIANIARRKMKMSWDETDQFLMLIRSICPVESLTLQTHERGIVIARRYGLSLYDSTIVAAALQAGCQTLYSEDMQNGLRIDGKLTIRNPSAG